MAYPRSFLRLILKWQLPGGEVANTTCSWDAVDPIVALDPDTATALSGRADSFWGVVQNQYSPGTSYVGSSVAWIAPAGTTLARIDAPVTPQPGTASGNPLPNEVAVVMSLRTASAGRRTRGRMYLPPMTINTMNAQARYPTAVTTELATAGAALLANLTVGAETYTSVVASATGSLLTPVLEVAVGDVPDAQRRRRDQLIEAYVTHAVA